ncbi:MAG: leucine-rich repeat domain-containing protein [Clostridia bacterium]|nr:leucine-rich repeat domain-containing protein [Clostridia bacterium]
MYKCRNCKTLYLGRFCPECGVHFREEVIYPICCRRTDESAQCPFCKDTLPRDIYAASASSFPVTDENGREIVPCGLEFEKTSKGYLVAAVGFCRASEIAIPSVYRGEEVMGIGDGAFKYCAHITKVTIPFSGYAVGAMAFTGCTALREVVSAGMKSIGKGAFSGCAALISVGTNYELSEVGDSAFSGCESLKRIELTKNLKKVGEEAFSGCLSLEEVFFYGSEEDFGKADVGASNEPFSGAKKTFLPYPSHDVIKDLSSGLKGTLSQKDASGYSKGLLMKPGEDGYLVVGRGSCEDGEIVVPPEQRKRPVVGVAPSAFSCSEGLVSVVLPKSVTSIGSSAFSSCKDLASVSLPDGLAAISSFAFSGCDKLENVTIPKSVTSIGDDVFLGCDKLETITYLGSGSDWNLISVGSSNANLYSALSFAEKDASVGGESAAESKKRGKKKKPESVEDIPVRADDAPTVVSSGLKFEKEGNGFVVMDMGSCVNKNVVLPELHYGKQIVGVAGYAFENRNKIKSVYFPETIKYIGVGAFSGCSSLSTVSVPGGVTVMNLAFSGCTSLLEITLGAGVILSENAFSGCRAVRKVTYLGKKKEIEKSLPRAFGRKVSSLMVYPNDAEPDEIPAAAENENPDVSELRNYLETYSERQNASEGLSYMGRGKGLMVSGKGSCRDADIVVPYEHLGLAVIGVAPAAFMNDRLITSVYLPDTVTVICERSFSGCSSLSRLYIPDSITAIGSRAICDCPKLERVVIPKSVTTVGTGMFDGCDSLRSILYLGDEKAWRNIVFSMPKTESERFMKIVRFCVEKSPSRYVIIFPGET